MEVIEYYIGITLQTRVRTATGRQRVRNDARYQIYGRKDQK
jgi:hypothetical protein